MTTWDREVTGLHILTRGVKCSYYLYYRTKFGKQRRSKLGDFSVLTLTQARTEARKILAQVTLGGDPFGDMKKRRGDLTVQEVFDELWDEHYSKERFTNSRWGKEVGWAWNAHLRKAFGACKVTSVRAPDVREWHIRYEASPYAGNRSKSILSKLFSFAEMKGYIPVGSNPCRAVPNHPERKRIRFATTNEVLRVGNALAKHSGRYPRETAFIYLLMFTGSRPSAIERSTWNNLAIREVNGIRCGILRVKGKTGEDIIVIPGHVLELLERLRGSETLTGIKFPREFWNLIRQEAGCSDLWARDWRRTFATVGLSSGMPLGTLQQLLNHEDPKSTSLYAKLLLEYRVEASLQIGETMRKRSEGTTPRETVEPCKSQSAESSPPHSES